MIFLNYLTVPRVEKMGLTFTKIGPPTYADATAVAQAYVKAAPERLVWGSDWPHPSEQRKPALPDDALLFDLLAQWAPDEAVRNPGESGEKINP